MDPSNTWIVMPAFNEATVIQASLLPLIEAGYQVVVVDDASSDQTREAVEKVPGLHYLRHRVNLGQGAALQTGMTYVRSKGGKYLVHFDADGQHRMEDIPALLAPLEAGTADVVLGCRFLTPAGRAAVPRARRWLLRIGIGVNFVFSGLWLQDAHNGLRAMNQHALHEIDIRQAGMAHATEILQLIRRKGLRWQEVPVQIRYTAYSRHKGQSVWNAFNILGQLLARQFLHR